MVEQPQPPAPAEAARPNEAKTALEGALEIKKGIIRVDETTLNARDWRNGTLLTKEGRKTATNLVDYLKEDSQIVTMLKEVVRLGILKEQDLAQMGIGHKIYLSGEKADLKLYSLNHQQKAEALAFLLEKFSGGNLSKPQRELYFKRVFNEVVLKGVQHVDNEGGSLPIFSPRDVINCLIIAGHEENAEYLLQQGYRPSDRFEKLDKSRRQVAAEVSTTPQPNYTRELEGKMKAVAHRGERLNIPHTVDVDLRVAQAMFNVFLPAQDQITMAKIQLEIDKTTDPTQKENLRKQLVDKRREAYAAILNAFETEGYQIGGKYLQEISQRSAQNRVIDRAKEMNNDEGAIKRFKDKSIFEANRESLTLFASEILGVKEDRVRNAISKLDWSENKFEQLKNQLRQPGFSESHLTDLVYDRLFEEFYNVVKPPSERKDQPTKEDKTLLKLMFKERYLTEKALRDRFKNVENPYQITLSEMQDFGIKGLDLLFRRTLPGYHEVESYEDYVQSLRDRLKELAEQPPAPTPPAPPAPTPLTAAPAPVEVPSLDQLEQQLQAWGLKPDQYVIQVQDVTENKGTPQERKVPAFTLNQLTFAATEENAKALSQLGETLKNQGISLRIIDFTLHIPKEKAATAIDLGNCQLGRLKIEGEPAGKINIQNAKAATIELGNNLTARLEPADLKNVPINKIQLGDQSTLTIDQKYLPLLQQTGTKITLGEGAKINDLSGPKGEYKIGKAADGSFTLEKAEAVVQSPPVKPTGPPKTKAQQVKEGFKGAATGLKEAAQAKIDQYVQRIMDGENAQRILSGLPKGWQDEISKRLKEERGKQKAPTPPVSQPPQIPPTEAQAAAELIVPNEFTDVTQKAADYLSRFYATVKEAKQIDDPTLNKIVNYHFRQDKFNLAGEPQNPEQFYNSFSQVWQYVRSNGGNVPIGYFHDPSGAEQLVYVTAQNEIKKIIFDPTTGAFNHVIIPKDQSEKVKLFKQLNIHNPTDWQEVQNLFKVPKPSPPPPKSPPPPAQPKPPVSPPSPTPKPPVTVTPIQPTPPPAKPPTTAPAEARVVVQPPTPPPIEAPAYTVVPPGPSTTVAPPPVTPVPQPAPAEPTVVEATVIPPQEQLSETEQLALRQYFYLNELALAVDKDQILLKVKMLETAAGISKTSSQLKDKKPEELGDLRQTVTAVDQNKKIDSVGSLYYLLTENITPETAKQIKEVLKQVSPDLLKDKNMNFALANVVLRFGTPSQKKLVIEQLEDYFGIEKPVVFETPKNLNEALDQTKLFLTDYLSRLQKQNDMEALEEKNKEAWERVQQDDYPVDRSIPEMKYIHAIQWVLNQIGDPQLGAEAIGEFVQKRDQGIRLKGYKSIENEKTPILGCYSVIRGLKTPVTPENVEDVEVLEKHFKKLRYNEYELKKAYETEPKERADAEKAKEDLRHSLQVDYETAVATEKPGPKRIEIEKAFMEFGETLRKTANIYSQARDQGVRIFGRIFSDLYKKWASASNDQEKRRIVVNLSTNTQILNSINQYFPEIKDSQLLEMYREYAHLFKAPDNLDEIKNIEKIITDTEKVIDTHTRTAHFINTVQTEIKTILRERIDNPLLSKYLTYVEIPDQTAAPEVTEAPAYTVVPPGPSTTVEPPPVTPAPKPSPAEAVATEATVVPAAVEAESDIEHFSSSEWKALYPYLEEISPWNEDIGRNRAIHQNFFDSFQSAGPRITKLTQESQRRISEPKQTAELDELKAQIDSFETLARELEPSELHELCNTFINTSENTASGNPEGLTERLNKVRLDDKIEDAPARFLDSWFKVKALHKMLTTKKIPDVALEAQFKRLENHPLIGFKTTPPSPSVEPPEVKKTVAEEPKAVESIQPPTAQAEAATVETPQTVTVPLESLIKERDFLAKKYGNIPAFLISNPDDRARLQQIESAIKAQQIAEKPAQEKPSEVPDFLKSRQKEVQAPAAVETPPPETPIETPATAEAAPVVEAPQETSIPETAEAPAIVATPEPIEPKTATETPLTVETKISTILSSVGEKLGLTEEQKNNLANSLPLIQQSHQLSDEDMSEILYRLGAKAELIKNARPLTEQALPPKPKEGKGFGRLRIGKEKDFKSKTQARETAEKELKEYNFVHDLIEQLIINKSPEEKGVLAARFYRILQTMFPSFPSDQPQLIHLLLREENREKQAAILEILQLV